MAKYKTNEQHNEEICSSWRFH